MCLRQYSLPLFFLVCTAAAQASGISRCVQADAPPQFTNQPCPEGVMAEPLELVENTPLDSSAVRARLAQGKARAKPGSTGPQVVLIEDSYTAERNARVSDKPAKKKKKQKRKKKTAKADKKKTSASKEKPDS
jgi:hypothetical protein